jgi:pimeloyl-ACP methyl ester carboxylesterase
MARDAVAILDALGIGRAAIYGISLGGMVASWLALDASDRITRLVLASTPLRGRAAEAGDWRRMLKLAACMLQPARAAEACLAMHVLSDHFVATQPDEVERIRARARTRPASHRGLLTLFGAALTHDVSDHLAAVRAETLVIAGSEDTLLPMPERRRVADCLVHSRFVVVPDAGHDVSAEAPDAVAALVTEHALRTLPAT